jgi:uncharacterized protein
MATQRCLNLAHQYFLVISNPVSSGEKSASSQRVKSRFLSLFEMTPMTAAPFVGSHLSHFTPAIQDFIAPPSTAAMQSPNMAFQDRDLRSRVAAHRCTTKYSGRHKLVPIKQWPRAAQLIFSLVLAMASIAICVGAYRWLVMGALGYWFALGGEASVAIRRIGTVAMLFTGYWLFARFYERRPITEFAFKPAATLASALIGALLISLTIAALYLLGNYQLAQYRGFGLVVGVMGTLFVGVIVEEMLFRGIVFKQFEQYFGTTWALVIPSVLFGLAHMDNDGATFMTLLSGTSIGIFWSLIYAWSRNIWVVSANHAAWNIAIFLTGLPLSGQTEWRSAAPFESSYQGSALLTGGGFGPEDSIINVVFMGIVIAAFWVWGWRRGLMNARGRNEASAIGLEKN